MAAARSETIMMLLDKCKEREKTVDELAGEIVVMNTNYA